MRRKYYAFVSESGKNVKVFSVKGKEVTTVENLTNGTKSLNIGFIHNISKILKHGDYISITKKDFMTEYRGFITELSTIDIKSSNKRKVLI